MINFMSLLRPSAQQPAAGKGSAESGNSGTDAPVSIFAALVQKVLGDFLGGGAIDQGVSASPQPGFFLNGKPVDKGNPDEKALNVRPADKGNPDEKPLESGPPGKKNASVGAPSQDPVLVSLSQLALMQTVGAADASTAPVPGVTPTIPVQGGGGGPASPAIAPLPVDSGLAAQGASDRATTALPQAQSDDGEILLSLLRNVPPSGRTVPASPVQSETAPRATNGDAAAVVRALSDASLSDALHTPAPASDMQLSTAVPSPGSAADPPSVRGAIDVLPLRMASAGVMESPVLPQPAPVQTAPRTETVRRSEGDVRRSDAGSSADGDQGSAPGVSSGFPREVIGARTAADGRSADGSQRDNVLIPPPVVNVDGEKNDLFVTAPAVQTTKKDVTDGTAAVQNTQAAPVAEGSSLLNVQAAANAVRSAQGAQTTPVVTDRPAVSAPASPVREMPTPYAPLPAEVSRRIADQVVRNLNLQVDGTTSEMRMTLKPPSLGEVQLRVHVEDAKMQAQIDVSQQVVKSALEAHMPALRLALQEHGIEVQRIDVVVPEQMTQRDGNGSADGGRTGRRGGRRSGSVDDAESIQSVKDMGYNTIELIM